MAIPTILHLTGLPEIEATWSDRNGGQVFLFGGGVRGILARETAQSIVDKLSRALDAPRRRAEIAARDPLPEPERITAPDTMIAEPFRHRHGALIGAFPAKAKRLAAVEAALEACDGGAEIVAIGGIAFTLAEAEGLRDGLMSSRVTIDRDSEAGSYARHLRHTAVMRQAD